MEAFWAHYQKIAPETCSIMLCKENQQNFGERNVSSSKLESSRSETGCTGRKEHFMLVHKKVGKVCCRYTRWTLPELRTKNLELNNKVITYSCQFCLEFLIPPFSTIDGGHIKMPVILSAMDQVLQICYMNV